MRYLAATEAIAPRNRRNSVRASSSVAQTLVPISICERKNSGLTWAPSSASNSVSIAAGGSPTTSRVARSTRKYSSSMPRVNSGPGSTTRQSPDAEDRAGLGARVAPRPAASFNLMEKLIEGAVEQIRLLEVDRMAGVREDDERGGRDRPLHQNAGFEAGMILVAGHDQGRDIEAAHTVGQIPQRRPLRLNAAHRQCRAFGRMSGEVCSKFTPPARVLGLELHSARALRIDFARLIHPLPFDQRDRLGGFGVELLALVPLGAVAATRDHQRQRAAGIGKTKMQRREPAHRNADDMGLI